MSSEAAPATRPASAPARALKALQGSFSSLSAVNTSAPLRSNARANVGAPPRKKSAAARYRYVASLILAIASRASSALFGGSRSIG
jgi:hypothetical protein